MSKKGNKKASQVLGVTVLAVLAGFIGYVGADGYTTIKSLKRNASSLKTQLKAISNGIDDEDPSSAQNALNQVNVINTEMKDEMNQPIIQAASVIPGVSTQVKSMNTLLKIVDEASANVLSPIIETTSAYPVSQLKAGEDGFNVNLINTYLNLAEEIMPEVKNLSAELNTVNLSFEKDKIEEYKKRLNTLSDQYDDVSGFLPVLHAVLGDGSDRYYLFPIQNTAEIRACGGFPGSIGSITISNGILTIGDFDTPYNIFPEAEGEGWSATPDEVTFFSPNVTTVRDAGFNPDFSRTAYIWAKGKEAQSGQHVDGVISMTPAMVQDMLGAVGQQITLSDGTVLDGTNATKYLQYDIYDKYFQEYTGSEANEITDALFAETAEKAMSAFVSSFSFQNIVNYMPLITNGIKTRELMFWFENTDQEQAAVNADCAGTLNTGKDSARTGVFLSFSGTKAGWLFDINNQVLDQTKNSDGTTTYHVQTDIHNNMTQQIIDEQNPYIMNYERNGIFNGYLQIAAPYGGTISDAVLDGNAVAIGQYAGSQLAYTLNLVVHPQSSATMTYTITTAADVSDDLSFVTTPTLTKYREASQ